MKDTTVRCYVSGFVTMKVRSNDNDQIVSEIKSAVLEDPEAIEWERLSVSDVEFPEPRPIDCDIMDCFDSDVAYEEARDRRHGLLTA